MDWRTQQSKGSKYKTLPQVNLQNIPEEFLVVGGWLFWFFISIFVFTDRDKVI